MKGYILLFGDKVLAYGEFYTLLNLVSEHAKGFAPDMQGWDKYPWGDDWHAFKPGDLIMRSKCNREDEPLEIGPYSVWQLPNHSEDWEAYEIYTHS